MAHGISDPPGSMQDLSLQSEPSVTSCGIWFPEVKSGPHAMGAWSPSHWTTREVPMFLNIQINKPLLNEWPNVSQWLVSIHQMMLGSLPPPCPDSQLLAGLYLIPSMSWAWRTPTSLKPWRGLLSSPQSGLYSFPRSHRRACEKALPLLRKQV